MSSKAKIKGTRVENDIVKLYQKEGYKARRQPMSGAISAFPHDVFIDDLHEGTNAEVKARKNEDKVPLILNAILNNLAVLKFESDDIKTDEAKEKIRKILTYMKKLAEASGE